MNKIMEYVCYVGFPLLLKMSIMASIAILGVVVVRLMLKKAPKIFSYVLWSVVLFRLLCPFSISTPFSIINVDDFTVKSIDHEADDKDTYYDDNVGSINEGALYVDNIGSANEGALYVDNIGSANEGALDLHTSGQERNSFISREQNNSITQNRNESHREVYTYSNADLEEIVQNPMSESMTGAAGYAKTESLPERENVTGRTSFMKSLPVLAMLWIVGMTVFLSINMAGFLRIKRRVSASLHVRDNIYIADGVISPFCMGLVKPQIYLPSSIAEDEKTYVILHEQHHIKRLDHVIKLIAFVALGIHWFNPLVWVAFVLAGKDMEMSCDEAVIKQMNENDRSAYAMSLLKLATGRRNLQISTLSFGAGDPKERIKNVMNYKKATFVVMVSAVALCIVIGIILGTNRTKQDELENIEPVSELSSVEIELQTTELSEVKGENELQTTGLSEVKGENVIQNTEFSEVRGENELQNTELLEANSQTVGKNDSQQLTIEEVRRKYAAFVVKVKEINAYNIEHAAEGKYADDYLDAEGNPLYAYEALNRSFQVPAYCRMDLNDDGIPELLFGEYYIDENEINGWNQFIYDMYTIKNGEIVHVFSGGTRNIYYITGDGLIARRWSSSAWESGESYYKLDGENLILVEEYEYISNNGKEKYTYRNSSEEKEVKEAEVNRIKESHPKKNLDLAEFYPERKTIYGNIDDNPIVEYAIFYGDAFNIMDFYFNGEMVYHHEDLLNIQMDETHIAYVDLDHDGEKELFLPILPAVNSMPLTEYAIIKNIDGVWTKLEVYQGEDTRDNTFPIHAVREDDEYTIAVYCDGLLDHKRTFSMEPAYNYRKEKAEQGEYYAQEVVNFYEQEVFSKGIGEEVGQICAWGVWSIQVDTYDGQPCLRAEQGIQGDGKFDIWTCVDIYFDYDQQGKIHLLDLQLEPK